MPPATAMHSTGQAFFTASRGRYPARWRAVAGALTLALSAAYVALSLQEGWVPHDAGQLGHCAERILQGEMPHRDFDEPYTGGLTYLNALAFWLFGVRIEALRWMLFAFFVGFTAAVYWITSRVGSPAAAASVTFLSVCFSLPIYSSGMPSWYNLFFATFATVALLRHRDTGRMRWLVVAGICGGCSLLAKITGLYLIAAALLYLVYYEQFLSCSDEPVERGYGLLTTSGLAAFSALGLLFVKSDNPLMGAVHFWIPMVALAGFIAAAEWRNGRGRFPARAYRLLSLLGPFFIGVGLVITSFAIPYAITGALPDLYRGVFVQPRTRLGSAAVPLPPFSWFVLALPLALPLILGLRKEWSVSRVTSGLVLAGLVGLLALSHTSWGYLVLFQALRHQIPLVVLTALALLGLSSTRDGPPDGWRQDLLLLVAMTLMVSLVQFPYAFGIYFFYTAPLMVVTAYYMVMHQPAAPRLLHGGILAFWIFFAVLRVHQPDPALMNGHYDPGRQVEPLRLQRCGVAVRRDDARLYQQLVALVQDHSPPGSYIYAAPDCPEVYFLSARRNPTRTMYDFFEPRDADRSEQLLALLDQREIKVVVINQWRKFSAPMDRRLVAGIETRFPHRVDLSTRISDSERPKKRFRVLWRK